MRPMNFASRPTVGSIPVRKAGCPSAPLPRRCRMAQAALELMPSCLIAPRQWRDEGYRRLRVCLSNPYSLIFAPCSAPMLSDEISQAIFCIAGFAKASPNQLLDPLLCGWSCHRSNARVPPGFDFDIRRQTSDVDKAPGIHDCPFVEGGDSGGKRIDKSVKVSIRQRPIHVAIGSARSPGMSLALKITSRAHPLP